MAFYQQGLHLKYKAWAFREMEAFSMAHVFPQDTGLPMIVYISPKVWIRGQAANERSDGTWLQIALLKIHLPESLLRHHMFQSQSAVLPRLLLGSLRPIYLVLLCMSSCNANHTPRIKVSKSQRRLAARLTFRTCLL